ncbi:MAG: proline--tRNA ligase [Deltaproteobacteria bacterium]|jgi:prolyl-tRNA synthetase|nr:proline--tRNA ligase [Deltaproteobacteria bacterium]
MTTNDDQKSLKINAWGETIGERVSTYLSPTLKEDPADAEVISHKLMVRAGLIRKLSAGIYNYLPMGLRSLWKLERIIRSEMNRSGAKEILLPCVQPGDLWRESGRWEQYGPELLRFKDRHDHDCVFGPTHEEVVTDIIRREIRSFRDLPLNLYQIQTKFRDEIRPRFGLMRGREFIMKDAYSFDVDDQGAEVAYRKMYRSYENIFRNCGLQFAVVEADSGPIGGSYSHEFMVLADTGEDALVSCPGCGYAANMEKAELTDYPAQSAPAGPLTKIHTPNCTDVPTLARFLNIPESSILKSMLFEASSENGPEHVLVVIPGNREINLIKLKNALGGLTPVLCTPQAAEEITGVIKGYVTPLGAKVRIIADQMSAKLTAGVVGAGEKDYHFTGARPGVDFKIDGVFDLAQTQAADPCPRCGAPIVLKRGIEVGHVFKLGTKYSKALGSTFTAPDGSDKLIVMGCYGIGVGRTLAASIEQNHDRDGIIWPMALAPFQVILLPLEVQNEQISTAAETLFDQLTELGVETLLDDRDLRPGNKFKDADLLGIPIKITISKKGLANGQFELKHRRTGEVVMIPEKDASKIIFGLCTLALQKGGQN